jgi:hypothetical protein
LKRKKQQFARKTAFVQLGPRDRSLEFHLEANQDLSPTFRKATKELKQKMGKLLRLLDPE